jgi:hypothetical protein
MQTHLLLRARWRLYLIPLTCITICAAAPLQHNQQNKRLEAITLMQLDPNSALAAGGGGGGDLFLAADFGGVRGSDVRGGGRLFCVFAFVSLLLPANYHTPPPTHNRPLLCAPPPQQQFVSDLFEVPSLGASLTASHGNFTKSTGGAAGATAGSRKRHKGSGAGAGAERAHDELAADLFAVDGVDADEPDANVLLAMCALWLYAVWRACGQQKQFLAIVFLTTQTLTTINYNHNHPLKITKQAPGRRGV